jgi:folylpolyglutamate synthase/dihydropteroate synthase
MVNVTVKETDISGQKVVMESQGGWRGTFRFPLIGAHQVENLATCAAVRDTMEEIGIEIDDASFKEGVAEVSWPGRFQVLDQSPPVILDGAHNPAAAEALVETMRKSVGFSDVGMVIGMCDDKDSTNFLKPFAKIAKKIWVVPLANERSQDPDKMLAVCREIGIDAEVSELKTAMRDAKTWAWERGSAVCITGSLFLVGEVLENINED